MIKFRIKTQCIDTLVMLTFVLVFAVVESKAETYTYNEVGRLTRVVYTDGTAIEYTYDDNGNRLTLTVHASTGGGTNGGDDDDDDGGGGGGGCFIATMRQ